MRIGRIGLLVFVLFFATLNWCSAREGRPVLNPQTYVSPSGVYALTVDPSHSDGQGPADCRFVKDGKPVWSKRLPYTLWETAVSDSGQIVGCAYTDGDGGFSKGDFIVAIYSSDGKPVLEEKHKREGSHFEHGRSSPAANGVLIDESKSRAVIRIADPDVNRNLEQWWIFDLESGKRIAEFEPGRMLPETRNDERLRMLAARAVPGTSLVLTHWFKYESGKRGGIFALFDLDDLKSKPAWSVHFRADYPLPDEEGDDEVTKEIWSGGAILDVNKSPGFAIHAVRKKQRIDFAVEKAEDKSWQIRETGRTAHDFPSAPETRKAEDFPPLKFEEAGVVRLRGGEGDKDNPIRDVYSFCFDDAGKMCVLTVREHADPHLLYLTQQGQVLKDLRVPYGKLPELVDFSNPTHVGGSKFVVAVSEGGKGGKARCFVADFGTERVTEVPEFDCPAVQAVAGFPDGRFAVLAQEYGDYGMSRGLYFYDIQGKFYWRKLKEGYTHKPDDFLSPEDIDRVRKDSIVVLDNIRHTLQLFDTKGEFQRIIDLKDAWKREPRYPTHVVEDADGGFVVYDFNAKTPLVRTDAKGAIRSEFAPKFADGRPVEVRHLGRSPDGRVWATDGDVLLRFSDTGTVDRTLGEEAAEDAIYQTELVAVGPKDRVFVADARTHAVHVFDADGKKEGICVPSAEDLTKTSMTRHVAATEQGDIFVDSEITGCSYVHFDKSFKRVGRKLVAVDNVVQEWHFQPGGSLCWIGGYADVFLVKDLGDVVRTVSRRADGRWLEDVVAIGVAPDGSLAVRAASESEGRSVSTYSPAGEPRATFIEPKGWYYLADIAYDGHSVFVQDHNNVYVIGPNNACVGCFRLPFDDPKTYWDGPFLAAEGKQLWFVDRKALTVHKYAISPDLGADKSNSAAAAKEDPVLAAVEDVPGLPRVLLIGDSISMGYTLPVRESLRGKANVHRPAENCGPTTRGGEKLDAWIGDGHWDVVHFNFGLHDLKYVDGRPQVSLADYEKNLRTIVKRLKETGAKLIWCTTTPVPKKSSPPRHNEDVLAYNAAAKKVMEENEIAIDDLYAFAEPQIGKLQRRDNVHFTGKGYETLSTQVSKTILDVLQGGKPSASPSQ